MNHLAGETSPYLLQHADNPVDWYPWGEESLARAKAEDKPILLSIGYSACHWCHVMAHESFEDKVTAAIMNDHFVCIKVDREERPDLDAIYMQAVQALNGSGGWPLTAFLTPEGIPFYGGTYYPPEDRHGLPGFRRVLLAVADAYANRRQELLQNSQNLIDRLQQDIGALPLEADTTPSQAHLDQALLALQQRFDAKNGGFGPAPKFPHAMALSLALQLYVASPSPDVRRMVDVSLRKMARGGIYDQVGGGFHRYSVDETWLVPHFEKMCYDNALLSRLYLEAYQALGDPLYRRIAEETLEYVQRDMTSPEGGFYASQDADSEGEEGKFYVWTPEEILEAAGPMDGAILMRYYGVYDRPNFDHKNILYVPRDDDVVAQEEAISEERLREALQRGRVALWAIREERVHPARDTKILAAWNGLMLTSFARAAAALDRADFRETAIRSGQFLMAKMRHDGRLWRSYADGQAHLDGYLEDCAAVGNAFLDLWELTFDLQWFKAAEELASAIMTHFYDASDNRFYDTSDDHEKLIIRPSNLQDNATPSGGALAAELFQRLAAYLGEGEYSGVASAALRAVADLASRYPSSFGHWLGVLAAHLASPPEVAIIGEVGSPDVQALLNVVRGHYRAGMTIAVGSPESEAARAIPLLADRHQADGRATAYVCHHHACRAPVTEPEALAQLLA